MDCTHCVQQPGGANGKTGGDRRYVPMMAEAAKAFGATGFFLGVHPDPDRGLSDAANMLELDKLEGLVAKLVTHSLVKSALDQRSLSCLASVTLRDAERTLVKE
jgi:3-deoxy-D-manno-octulosonic acid (KDO) 8-phosphate synthase